MISGYHVAPLPGTPEQGSTTKATVSNWFKTFRDGDFSLANEPRGRPKTKVDNDHLRAVVEFDPSQSTRELASIFNVSIPTILVHLAAIGSTTKATVGNWFKNFRDGDFSLANEPRGRPKTKVDNDHLRAVVESDPSQSTRELASIFNVSIPTILVHLAAIGSTTKATVGNWFKNFRDGDFSLANEPRGRPKTKVDNDHLRAVVESDPSQSTRELASIFNVSISTILVHLAAIGSTTKATVGNWFKNFRDGDFSLANEPRGRPKTKVDNDHLRAVVESDPSQSTRELASIFNVSIPTILVHLAAIGVLRTSSAEIC
ncbi:hypothetical protein DMN91_012234 [Ooceraea biroi]|uniref:Mos1 transposase HTH domain-containing protein n=1 Tax=Ooceraea biroi TaxID=2015173 RepID=A0A3L8D4B6_OOCBI|nr:hypothetical protein DMN91_012234 [Ooceraea biroi]